MEDWRSEGRETVVEDVELEAILIVCKDSSSRRLIKIIVYQSASNFKTLRLNINKNCGAKL